MLGEDLGELLLLGVLSLLQGASFAAAALVQRYDDPWEEEPSGGTVMGQFVLVTLAASLFVFLLAIGLAAC